ncbi:bifunctional Helicase [Babesia duncani]|uniref:Bifunctional Helicase n=1 Tax=Babesia duncani TaxID=323732 RepID=A0AAD9UQX7_9APIC|nr:bifunctional Helicase [Babesia duncani]
MARLYNNDSDFWTSDDEDDENVEVDLKQPILNSTSKNVDYLDIDRVFAAPLESLRWVPLVPQSTQRYNVFDVLDKDIDNLDYYDMEYMQEQLCKTVLDSDDEKEFEEPEFDISIVDPLVKQKDAKPILKINVHDTVNKTDSTAVATKEELIVPPPDTNKNYIRTKWSIVDESPPPVLEDLLIEYPFELDDFQKRAIHHLINNKHVFVAAHTSAGKTLVAEYAVAMAINKGTKAIYTSPIKALSNQKFREFKKIFGADLVGIITGDVICNPGAACLIVTTEILRNLLYRGDSIIGQLSVVIFDEIHYINDPSRGVVWEEVIIMLPKSLQLVMLSATVPNYTEFADWIGAIMQREVITIVTSHRPTPLKHYLYSYGRLFPLMDDKGFNKDAYYNMHQYASQLKTTTNLTFKGQVQKLQKLIKLLEINDKLPVVLFCFNCLKCEMFAKEMPNVNLAYTQNQRSRIHLFIKEALATISEADRQLPQLKSIIKLLQRGIGVHHSGLLPIIKEIVEILFSRGLIKILFATETFAMGVNMPARSVVFTAIHKHDGTKTRHLTSSEYTQMAGRAGRRGLDSCGNVFIFCPQGPPDLQDLTIMMMEKSTRLESKFRITYNMILQMQSREHMRITDMMLKSFRESAKMKSIPLLKRDLNRRRMELENMPKIECIYGQPSITEYYKLMEKARHASNSLHENLWNHKANSQVFKVGRVLMVHSIGPSTTGCFASIIESSKAPSGLELKLLVLLPNLGHVENMKIHIGITPVDNSEFYFTRIDTVAVSSICFVYNNILQTKAADITSDASLGMVAAELHALVHKRKLELLVFNKQLKQTCMLYYETVLKQRDAFHQLSQNKCTPCPLRHAHFNIEQRTQKCHAEIEDIGKMLKDESLHSYHSMLARLEVLRQFEFLDDAGKPTLKGRIATHLTTGDEITLTEALVQNVLAGLEPEECAAILSAFVHSDRGPEQEAPCPTLAIQTARDTILQYHAKLDVVQRALRIDMTKEEHDALCNFSLLFVVYQWARGVPFGEIMKLTQLQEGHIVRAITRLDEICRKIAQVAAIIGNEALGTQIEAVMRAIRRDIVFAPSLYLS